MSENASPVAPVQNIVHTPGPWYAYFSVHGDPSVVIDTERPAFTEVCKVATSPDDYGQANARLIAAAPSMKKLIEDLYDAIQRGVGPMAGASDGEIGEMINDEMSNLFGNDWRSVGRTTAFTGCEGATMTSENGQPNTPVQCFVIVLVVIALTWCLCRWCDETGVIVWHDEPTPHFWFERALKQWIAERFHD